jgi:hypothetical protein
MGAVEIERFLTHPAVHGKLAVATPNQALCAMVFLYKHAFRMEINLKIDARQDSRGNRDGFRKNRSLASSRQTDQGKGMWRFDGLRGAPPILRAA